MTRAVSPSCAHTYSQRRFLGEEYERSIGWGSDVTTALSNWDIASDAELVRSAAAGDRHAFAMIYDRYADRLHDFCVGIVRDRDAAADCVQDVFCTAATQLPKLRDPDRLRPWLYAIARNEALRCIRDRRREQASDDLPEAASPDAGPDTLAARNELADLIAEAAGGLSDRDRTVLELAYRHGLDGPELADALEVSPGNANKMVSRLRNTVETSLGALLVARRAQRTAQACEELSAILAGWDSHFSVLMRKRITRHIESCSTCDDERRRLVNPVALLGGAPILIPAPDWLRDHTLGGIKLTSAGQTLSSSADGGSSDAIGPESQGYVDAQPGRARRLVPWVAMLAAVLFLSSMLTIALLHHHDIAVTPTELSGKAPAPEKPAVLPGFVMLIPNSPPPPAAPPAPAVITPPVDMPAPPAPLAPIGTVPPPVVPPPFVPPPVAPPPVLPPPVLLPPPIVAPPPLPIPPKLPLPPIFSPPTLRPPPPPPPPAHPPPPPPAPRPPTRTPPPPVIQ
jgi:RNA polymerase sigma factor (sigma-70 family)